MISHIMIKKKIYQTNNKKCDQTLVIPSSTTAILIVVDFVGLQFRRPLTNKTYEFDILNKVIMTHRRLKQKIKKKESIFKKEQFRH